MFKDKKAAMELSIGTIVVLVIAITLLVMGIVFVRSIMCAGIETTEGLSEGVKNEVRNLFNADEWGVKCVGEGSQEIKLSTGGRRTIVCIIRTDSEKNYDISAEIIQSKGAPLSSVERWIFKDQWKGSVSAGGSGIEAPVLVLDIPRDTPTTTIEIEFTVKDLDMQTRDTRVSIIDVLPAGFFRGSIC